MEEKAELLTCLEEKINSGKATIDRLKLVEKIDGIEKLIRKIQQEIRFLEKVRLFEIALNARQIVYSHFFSDAEQRLCVFINVQAVNHSLASFSFKNIIYKYNRLLKCYIILN